MPKLTAAARDLLESVAAGHVTGSYENRNTWYGVAAPVFDDLQAEAFDEFDPARRKSYNVSSRVCGLIEEGLVTVEAGPVTEEPARPYAALVATDAKPFRHMRAMVVLTAAGREALGLEPVADTATTLAPAAGSPATDSPAIEREGAGPAAFGAGASGGTFAGLIITGPEYAGAVRHAAAMQRRAMYGELAPAAPADSGPWPKYGMCRFCNNSVRQSLKGELWAVRGPYGEDLVECPDAPHTPTSAEKRHEPAALPGLSPAATELAASLSRGALGIPATLAVAAAVAALSPIAEATDDRDGAGWPIAEATDDGDDGWPKYSTCRFCRYTMRMDGPGEPWTVHGPAGTTYTQCGKAPNPEDGPMPPHEPGTAILSPPAPDAVPDTPTAPTSLGMAPPVPRIPRH